MADLVTDTKKPICRKSLRLPQHLRRGRRWEWSAAPFLIGWRRRLAQPRSSRSSLTGRVTRDRNFLWEWSAAPSLIGWRRRLAQPLSSRSSQTGRVVREFGTLIGWRRRPAQPQSSRSSQTGRVVREFGISDSLFYFGRRFCVPEFRNLTDGRSYRSYLSMFLDP